jgi:hypothetical protein
LTTAAFMRLPVSIPRFFRSLLAGWGSPPDSDHTYIHHGPEP